MKRLLLGVLVALGLCFSAQAQNMLPKKPAPFGVNLAGAEFGTIGQNNYGYPNASELNYYKSKGFALFRLPFKWERIQPQLNGPLDENELANLKAFVDSARVRGLWVLLDMHNYGRRVMNGKTYIIGSPELSVAHVVDGWTKIAREFRGYKNIWGYGIMNEPHDMLDSTPWVTIAQQIISGIRTVDKKNAIVVGGDSWSSAARWMVFSDNLKTLKDTENNLIFEAHVYFDSDASGSYKGTYEAENGSPTVGVDRAKPFVNWLKKNNKRGFIGEYGVPFNEPRWLVTLDNFMNYLKENGVNGTYWAAGPRWGTYPLSVEPINGVDRPQMETLVKYPMADKLKGRMGKAH